MATITPIAYNNSGTPIPGTTQLGSLAIGSTSQDYGAFPSGYRFWATPNEDLHYVIAYPVPAGNHPNPLSVSCSVGFFKSTVRTEESFIDLAQYISIQDNDPQTFTGGTEAKTWLNNNNYWTSYSDTWQYDSVNNLAWTDDTTGYTLLTGGVNATDDGYWVNPITIPTFYTNNQTSPSLYISTNAVVTLGVGYGNCCPSSPQTSANPALISGNAGDMFANPGAPLTDGTTMNAYYKITQNGDKTKIELKVFQAILSAQNSPYSYQLNLYRDSTYQWVETRVKTGIAGNVGPYNAIDVSQPASQTSRVWQGDLLGQNWVYLGTGTVVP